MEIKIGNLSKKIKQNSHDLITRPVGRKMYKKISGEMEIVAQDEVVILDFEKIKVIDSSFIDEFIVKLVTDSMVNKQFYIKLRNISDIAEINISSVLKSYGQFNKKIVVMTEDICLNNNFYIGDLSDQEHDTINFIRVNKQVSIEDLLASSGLSEENAKEILNSLIKMRLVRSIDKSIYSTV